MEARKVFEARVFGSAENPGWETMRARLKQGGELKRRGKEEKRHRGDISISIYHKLRP